MGFLLSYCGPPEEAESRDPAAKASRHAAAKRGGTVALCRGSEHSRAFQRDGNAELMEELVRGGAKRQCHSGHGGLSRALAASAHALGDLYVGRRCGAPGGEHGGGLPGRAALSHRDGDVGGPRVRCTEHCLRSRPFERAAAALFRRVLSELRCGGRSKRNSGSIRSGRSTRSSWR